MGNDEEQRVIDAYGKSFDRFLAHCQWVHNKPEGYTAANSPALRENMEGVAAEVRKFRKLEKQLRALPEWEEMLAE